MRSLRLLILCCLFGWSSAAPRSSWAEGVTPPPATDLLGQIVRLRLELLALRRANLAGVEASRLLVLTQNVRLQIAGLSRDVRRARPSWQPAPQARGAVDRQARRQLRSWRAMLMLRLWVLSYHLDAVEVTIRTRLRPERGVVTREVVKMGRQVGILARHLR